MAEDDYIPTTDEVRDAYAYNEWDTDPIREEILRRAVFDRWLAAHDAEVALKAMKQVTEAINKIPPPLTKPLIGDYNDYP